MLTNWDNFWGKFVTFWGKVVTLGVTLGWPLYTISNPPRNCVMVNPPFLLAMPGFWEIPSLMKLLSPLRRWSWTVGLYMRQRTPACSRMHGATCTGSPPSTACRCDRAMSCLHLALRAADGRMTSISLYAESKLITTSKSRGSFPVIQKCFNRQGQTWSIKIAQMLAPAPAPPTLRRHAEVRLFRVAWMMWRSMWLKDIATGVRMTLTEIYGTDVVLWQLRVSPTTSTYAKTGMGGLERAATTAAEWIPTQSSSVAAPFLQQPLQVASLSFKQLASERSGQELSEPGVPLHSWTPTSAHTQGLAGWVTYLVFAFS